MIHLNDNDFIDDEDSGYLISVADLMSGLVLIFIITLVAFIINFQEAIKKVEDVIAVQAGVVGGLTNSAKLRAVLLNEIQEKLKQRNIIVEVDEKNGILRLTETAVLFELGKASLDERNTENLIVIGEVLSTLVPCYANNPPAPMACSHKTKGKINSIFVEGHTDNIPMLSWDPEKDNLWLSTARANTAYKIMVPSTILSVLTNTLDQPIFSVSGYGDGRPVPGHTFSVPTADPVNRRIDIRFIMTPPTLNEEESKFLEDTQKLVKQAKGNR